MEAARRREPLIKPLGLCKKVLLRGCLARKLCLVLGRGCQPSLAAGIRQGSRRQQVEGAGCSWSMLVADSLPLPLYFSPVSLPQKWVHPQLSQGSLPHRGRNLEWSRA